MGKKYTKVTAEMVQTARKYKDDPRINEYLKNPELLLKKEITDNYNYASATYVGKSSIPALQGGVPRLLSTPDGLHGSHRPLPEKLCEVAIRIILSVLILLLSLPAFAAAVDNPARLRKTGPHAHGGKF